MSPVSSLTSADFSAGKWDGGRATLTNPRFEYRTATRTKDKSKFTVVEANVDWVDGDGEKHAAKYGLGSADFAMILAEAEDGADEANSGPAVCHRDRTLIYKPRADSEFGQLLTSLFTSGYPESKLGPGDITVLAGLDADVIGVPHDKDKPDDKYPVMIVTHIYGGGGMKKGGSGGAAAGKGTAAATATGRPKRGVAAAAEPDDDDETQPAKKSSAKDTTAQPSAALAKRARAMIIAVAEESDGVTTGGDVVRGTAKELRGDDERQELVDLFTDDEWLGSQGKFWKYNQKSDKITIVE